MSDVTAQLVDERHRQRLVRRFGRGAVGWLTGLPALVDTLARQWNLEVEGPAPHGRTSVVLHCRRADGARAILKLSPDAGIGASEARILGHWASTRRVPEVLETDDHHGAVLLESIGDGTTVEMTGALPPITEIGGLIADLHRVPMDRAERMELNPLIGRIAFIFDSAERCRTEGAAADVVAPSLLHHGFAWARSLANGSDDAVDDPGMVPLHGDLHPGNVLDGGAERGLVAVDPRACLGDPAADGIDWCMWRATTPDEVRRRASALAPIIGTTDERLLEWCRALAPVYAVKLAERGRSATPEFGFLIEAGSQGL